MSLTIVDHPTDRPEWIRELLDLVAERLRSGRAELLARVEHASDADVFAGTDQEWGIGQIAATGQPRPAASAMSRDGDGLLVSPSGR